MPEKRCRRCFGLLQTEYDESSVEALRCLNCGHREYAVPQAAEPHPKQTVKAAQKTKLPSRTKFPLIHSEVNKRGKVTTTADFFLDGEQHKIELSVPRKSLLVLGGLDRTRLENMLGNVFAYPLAHQVVREKSLYGRHADPNRREFMATAREIDKMLSAWIDAAPTSDPVLKRAIKVLGNGKSHPGNQKDRIILSFIERNWINIKRSFPDKTPTQIPQFLRNLRARPVSQMSDRYIYSTGYLGSGMDDAAFPTGRNPLCIEQRGRLLASGVLGGGWYLRQIANINFESLPDLPF